MPKPPKIPPLNSLKSATTPQSTLFTPTVPHAASKLPPTSSNASIGTTIDFRNPAPAETARERVARMREAARRARMQNLPWQDRMVETGRLYADYAHRGFVVFLMVLAAGGGVALLYTTVDIIRFARSKSKAFKAETTEKRTSILHEAMAATASGQASTRQRIFLERYERVMEAEEQRIQNRGPFGRAVDWAFPGTMASATQAKILAKLDEQMFADLEKARHQKRAAEETAVIIAPSTTAKTGGLLDNVAQNAANAAEKSTKSWTSWFWK